MTYETVWSGDTWRSFPPPQIAPSRVVTPRPAPAPRVLNPKRSAHETRAMVVSHLEAWKTLEALCYLTNRTPKQVYWALDELLGGGLRGAHEAAAGADRAVSLSTEAAVSEQIEIEDIERSANGYQTLGPAYFAARRIAARVMSGSDGEPFKQVAEKAADLVRDELYDYIETHLLSDVEVNFQGHLYRLVDDTVRALLTGERWALERYPLSTRYDADAVRKAIIEHAGDELMNARLADLENEVATLRADIQRERDYRYGRG